MCTLRVLGWRFLTASRTTDLHNFTQSSQRAVNWQRGLGRCRRMESFHVPNPTEFCMKMKTLVSALALTMAGIAMAQPATPNLDKREANQQQRIDQGVASGQLNAKETHRLDKREAKLAAN
jgi:hypothetical protein